MLEAKGRQDLDKSQGGEQNQEVSELWHTWPLHEHKRRYEELPSTSLPSKSLVSWLQKKKSNKEVARENPIQKLQEKREEEVEQFYRQWRHARNIHVTAAFYFNPS